MEDRLTRDRLRLQDRLVFELLLKPQIDGARWVGRSVALSGQARA